MDTEKLLCWFLQDFTFHWLRYCIWIILSIAATVLGILKFGRDYKQRIAKLEKQQQQSQTFNVAGNLITVNHKPVARFAQQFEMLDKVIPLANGQILTFFVPTVSVEYLTGDKETLELPKSTFEEVVKALENYAKGNYEFLKGMEPLHVKPDKLREMLKKYKDDDNERI